jgi:hypothetical protein
MSCRIIQGGGGGYVDKNMKIYLFYERQFYKTLEIFLLVVRFYFTTSLSTIMELDHSKNISKVL